MIGFRKTEGASDRFRRVGVIGFRKTEGGSDRFLFNIKLNEKMHY